MSTDVASGDKYGDIRAALVSADEEIRRQAVVSLRHHPFPDVSGLLRSSLGDASWRVRKEAVDCVLAACPDELFMDDLVDLLRSEDNAGLRNSAVEVLERFGVKAVPVLHRHRLDPDHDVRKFIIDIMGSIRDESFVPVLIEALHDPDANVSSAAAENLGKIGDERAIEPLLAALSRTDVMFRYTIIQALGRIGRPIPLEPIAVLLEDPLLKKVIYDCLGVVGDATAVAPLLDGMSQKMRSAREAAVLSLHRLSRRLNPGEEQSRLEEGLRRYRGTPSVEGLVPLFDTDNVEIKESVVWAAGIIDDERFIEPLLNCCRAEESRGYCISALKQIGPHGLQHLVSLFKGASPDDRTLIVFLIGETRCADCGNIVREALHDSYAVLRRVAAIAAGRIGLHELVGDVVQLLEDDDPRVRSGAIEALCQLALSTPGKIQDVVAHLANDDAPQKRREVIPLLVVLNDLDRLVLLAKDEDAAVRCDAVTALSRIGSHDITGHLVMALVDEDGDVRIAAAGSLGTVGGLDALHALLLALQDDDPWVRCAVLKALGEIGDRIALPAVAGLVPGADGFVVIEALHTLARIDFEQAREVIVGALRSSDADVVSATLEVLAGHGYSGWIEPHREMLFTHPDWNVRCRFVELYASRLGSEALPALRSLLETESDEMVRNRVLKFLAGDSDVLN